MKTNKKNIWDLVIIYGICLLPKLFVTFLAYPAWALSDEVSGISVAAMLAGYDWKEVVSNAGYYGFGFLFIFAPLFRIISSPLLIYRIIIFVEGMVEALGSVFCYKTLSIMEPKMRRDHKCFISILCGMIQIFSTVKAGIGNEAILILIVWMTVYLLAKIIVNPKSESIVKNEIFLLLLLTYALTVHTRSVLLHAGLFVISVIYWVICRKLPLHRWVYAILIAGYFIARRGVRIYQALIWTNAGSVRNGSVSTATSGFWGLIKTEGIDGYMIICSIRIILGQVYTACMVTGGAFAIILAAFIVACLKMSKNKADKEKMAWFVVGSFSLFCIGATIFAQSLTWMPGVYHGTEYGLKALMYLRYFGVYVSPLAMCGLSALIMNPRLLKPVLRVSAALIIMLTAIWRWRIYPMLEGTWLQRENYPQFSFLGLMKVGVDSTDANWMMASVLLLVFFAVCIVLLIKHRSKLFMALIIIFLMLEQGHVHVNKVIPQSVTIYNGGYEGYALLNELDEENQIDSIYVYDDKANENQNFYIYQFLNFRRHIIPEMPEDENWRFIFSNEDITDRIQPCWYVRLDDNEYVFIQNEDDATDVEALGYEIQNSGDDKEM